MADWDLGLGGGSRDVAFAKSDRVDRHRAGAAPGMANGCAGHWRRRYHPALEKASEATAGGERRVVAVGARAARSAGCDYAAAVARDVAHAGSLCRSGIVRIDNGLPLLGDACGP